MAERWMMSTRPTPQHRPPASSARCWPKIIESTPGAESRSILERESHSTGRGYLWNFGLMASAPTAAARRQGYPLVDGGEGHVRADKGDHEERSAFVIFFLPAVSMSRRELRVRPGQRQGQVPKAQYTWMAMTAATLKRTHLPHFQRHSLLHLLTPLLAPVIP